MKNVKGGGEAFKNNLFCLKVCLCRQSISGVPLFQPREETLDIWVIEAENGQSEKWNLVQKREEGLFDLVDPFIIVEMLWIDVGHHRKSGHQLEEGAIALIGFGYQKFSLPKPGIASDAVQSPSDHNRGVETTGRQNRGNERSGGGLSMSPCNGNSNFHPHQFCQHLRPGNDGDKPFLSSLHLGIAFSNG